MPLKIVVLSDLHIVPDGELSNTIDTAERLSAAVKSVNERHADADLCVLAGDLADQGKHAAYQRFEHIVADLSVPRYYMIGNHDVRNNFREVFPSHPVDENGYIQQVVDVKGHRIILMDSVNDGIVGGFLCKDRLAWLAKRLDESQGQPVFILIHHHVLPLRTPADRIILENGTDFVELVSRYENVRHVISGHVHTTTTGCWRGVPFTTLAGSHYSLKLHLPSIGGERVRVEGPAQYAVVLADQDHFVVHFEDFVDKHDVISNDHFQKGIYHSLR